MKMYFHKNNKVLLSASFRNKVYIIDHITTNDYERAYGAQEVSQEVIKIELTGDLAAVILLQALAKPQKMSDSESDNSELVYSRAEQITRK